MGRLPLRMIMLAIAVFFTAAAYCDDYYDGPPLKTIDGKVSFVDTLTSKITVSSANNVTCVVGTGTVIKQDIYDIKLSDVKTGDYVTVDYREDASGRCDAQQIVKHYNEGEGV